VFPGVVVTATATEPAAPGGVSALIVFASTTTTLVAGLPPNVTLVAPVRLVPVIVTGVSPSVVPNPGETPVTVGAGGGGATGAT
jgi:hypothetical protein